MHYLMDVLFNPAHKEHEWHKWPHDWGQRIEKINLFLGILIQIQLCSTLCVFYAFYFNIPVVKA